MNEVELKYIPAKDCEGMLPLSKYFVGGEERTVMQDPTGRKMFRLDEFNIELDAESELDTVDQLDQLIEAHREMVGAVARIEPAEPTPAVAPEGEQAEMQAYQRELASENAMTQLKGLLMEGETLTHVCIGPWAGGDDPAGKGFREPIPAVPQSYIGLAQDWSGAVGLQQFKAGPGSKAGTPMGHPCFAWSDRRVFFLVAREGGATQWAWVPSSYESGEAYYIA